MEYRDGIKTKEDKIGTAFMVIVQFRGSVGATIIGLVSLILLGWELHVSYITVQGIPILSPLIFMPSLHSIIIWRIFTFICLLSFLKLIKSQFVIC